MNRINKANKIMNSNSNFKNYGAATWDHNGDNARHRIAIDSSRNVPDGPRSNMISIHNLQLKNTHRYNTAQTKQQKFFKPGNTTVPTGNGSKPPHIRDYIPQKFSRIPNFGQQLLVSQGPERETVFLYVRPRIFKEENAESITRNDNICRI